MYTLMMVVVVCLLVFFWRKKRVQTQLLTQKSKSTSKQLSPYKSVLIEPCLIHCRAVIPYANTPILLNNCPALPIEGCNSEKCECKFIRYDDRRIGSRREDVFTMRQVFSFADENLRMMVGRRNDD